MRMTLQLAYALGRDAGNKSMRQAGRVQWNEDDFNAASAATQEALALLDN